MNDFKVDLVGFKILFAKELSLDAAQVLRDSDIYAYAVEVPVDLGNLYICSAVARVSKFDARWDGVDDLAWWESLIGCFEDKYTSSEWDYETSKASFEKSGRQLELIQLRHFTPYSIETESEELMHRNLIYTGVLDVMTDVLPPNSKLLKLIKLSDDEHHIERVSFNRLNSGTIKRRLWGLYNIHVISYLPIALFSNLVRNIPWIGKSRS